MESVECRGGSVSGNETAGSVVLTDTSRASPGSADRDSHEVFVDCYQYDLQSSSDYDIIRCVYSGYDVIKKKKKQKWNDSKQPFGVNEQLHQPEKTSGGLGCSHDDDKNNNNSKIAI